MTQPTPPMLRRAGFSLMELLLAVTVLTFVTGATYALFRSQSQNFKNNTARYDLIENARGAIEAAERIIRTMGAGTPNNQPVLVYGANGVLAFNTDYVEQDTVDMRWATYFNVDTPLEETTAWTQAAQAAIPNSSPSYTYPPETYQLGNGSPSAAETYILYFSLDAGTTRSDDYVLWQRVNAGTPEIVARNILAHPNGQPFFQYLMQRQLSTGDTLQIAPAGVLPLIRRPLVAGLSATDSANYVRPDSIRAVRMHFRLTNGESGTAERFRDLSTTIEVPNNGIPLPTVCGRVPLEPGALTATEPNPGDGVIRIAWTASPDQEACEQDVTQYIIWRRLSSATVWAEPLLVVRSEAGQTSYTTDITGHAFSTGYTFGIAAQDCTPSQSTIRTTAITTSAAP